MVDKGESGALHQQHNYASERKLWTVFLATLGFVPFLPMLYVDHSLSVPVSVLAAWQSTLAPAGQRGILQSEDLEMGMWR